jgi:hypothetical protein
MSLRVCIANGLLAHEELDALACVDVETGSVLGLVARRDDSREALDLATQAAAHLCTAPRLDPFVDDEEQGHAREAFIVSDQAIYLFAVSRCRPDLIVVGVARRAANVGLLLASVRAVADSLADERTQ